MRSVDKQPGDRVIGATINTSGAFEIEATSVGASSVLARIVTLMREAQGSQAPIQRLADRISAVFVPAVVSIAVGEGGPGAPEEGLVGLPAHATPADAGTSEPPGH